MKLGNILEGGLKAVLNAATSGLAGQIWDTIESALPDDMPPEKRAELKLQLERVAMEREIAGNQAAGEAERNLTERISVLEGTAKDLMAMPILGRLILFARGCQRPAWGFALMVIDYRIFDGSMKVPTEGPIAVAILVMNILILGFLFGERFMQNVLPMVLQLMGKLPPSASATR